MDNIKTITLAPDTCHLLKDGTLMFNDGMADKIRNEKIINIVIPSTFNDKPIKTIGNYMFNYMKNLKSVTISNGIENINEFAFSYCTNLINVNIPNSVTKIGSYAFSDPPFLKNKLKTYGFAEVNNILIRSTNVNKVIIPNNIVAISNKAFENNKIIKDLCIGENVKVIGANAFENCTNLENISFSNLHDDIEIETFAFSNCPKLKSIILPDGLHCINEKLFNKCHNLESITIPESIQEIKALAFFDCENLHSIKLPANIKTIDTESIHWSGILQIEYKGTQEQLDDLLKNNPNFKYELEYYKILIFSTYEIDNYISGKTCSDFPVDTENKRQYALKEINFRINNSNNLNEKLRLYTMHDAIDKSIIYEYKDNFER